MRTEKGVLIRGTHVELPAHLDVPDHAIGLVIFAHGSGSSRLSPRNRYVAKILRENRLATLLLDLLTETEAEDRECVFDIDRLAQRLHLAKKWAAHEPHTANLPIGYFGASTGAAAALQAAAQDPHNLFAVVSRGGRPDLAENFLPQVKTPTLLIVGGHDEVVIDLNRIALKNLGCAKKLHLVPGASHLFEEPGTLEDVAHLAADWFKQHAQGLESVTRAASV